MTELAACKGQQGDWLIDVTIDGKTEKLPSAHRYFLQGLLYSRPAFWLTPKRAKKGERYIEALRKHKRIVLTDDEVLADPMLNPNGEQSLFRRKGYIAVYYIDDIVADDERGLRFTLTKRVVGCK